MKLLASVLMVLFLCICRCGGTTCKTFREGAPGTLNFTLSAEISTLIPLYVSVEFYPNGTDGTRFEHLVDDCYLETVDEVCNTKDARFTFKNLDSGRICVLTIHELTDKDVGSYILKQTSQKGKVMSKSCLHLQGADSTSSPLAASTADESAGSSSDSVGAIVGAVVGCVVVVGVIVAVGVVWWRRKKNRGRREPVIKDATKFEVRPAPAEQRGVQAAAHDVENNGNDSFLHRPGNPDGRHGGRDVFYESTHPLLGDTTFEKEIPQGNLEEKKRMLENANAAGHSSHSNDIFLHGSGNPYGRRQGRDDSNKSTQPLLDGLTIVDNHFTRDAGPEETERTSDSEKNEAVTPTGPPLDESSPVDDSRLTQHAGPEEQERTLDTEEDEAVTSTGPPYDEGSPVDPVQIGSTTMNSSDDEKGTEEEEVPTDVKVAPGKEQAPIEEGKEATEETGVAKEEEASGSVGGRGGQGHQAEGTAVGSRPWSSRVGGRRGQGHQAEGTAVGSTPWSSGVGGRRGQGHQAEGTAVGSTPWSSGVGGRRGQGHQAEGTAVGFTPSSSSVGGRRGQGHQAERTSVGSTPSSSGARGSTGQGPQAESTAGCFPSSTYGVGGRRGQGHQAEDTAVGSSPSSSGQGTGHVDKIKARFEKKEQTPRTATARSEGKMGRRDKTDKAEKESRLQNSSSGEDAHGHHQGLKL